MALAFSVLCLLAGFDDAVILLIYLSLFLGVSLLASIPITLSANVIIHGLFKLGCLSFLRLA